jgi:F0F1-type ATP synthase membrane subunit b/b'
MAEFDTLMSRLDGIQTALNRLLGMSLGDARRDKGMAKGQDNLTREIEELSTKVDEYTSARAAEIEAAVAEARQAWESGTDAQFEQAAARLDEIAKKLGEENPADFEPSGN